MQDTKKLAAVYARSATSQEPLPSSPSFGVDTQIAACMQYATENGYQVVAEHIYQEIASGLEANRLILNACLEAATRGAFTTLFLYDYARLARNYPLLTSIIKQFAAVGVTVVAITEPFPDRTIEAFAIYALPARTRRKKAAPLGYTQNETGTSYSVNPHEAEIVQRVFEQHS